MKRRDFLQESKCISIKQVISCHENKIFYILYTRTRRHVSCTLFNIENETDCLETVELMLIIPVVRPRSDG